MEGVGTFLPVSIVDRAIHEFNFLLTPFRAPKYTINDMIDSKCVYPWNETLYNFWGPFEISVSNTDESVTQIIRHQQFFVTLILARPANLALFFAEFQVSLR